MAQTKIILLENIAKIGRKYQVKEVAAGFARNFLIPQKKAELATEGKIMGLEKRIEQVDKEKNKQFEILKGEADKLSNVLVKIEAKANEEGHLYGSVNVDDIVSALNEQYKIKIDPSWINIKGGSLKKVGEHVIKISSDNDVEDKISMEFKVLVEAVK